MDRREYIKEQRILKVQRDKFKLLVIITLAIIIIGVIWGSILSDAHTNDSSNPDQYRYYESIEIKSVDTLWAIAKKYKQPDHSVQTYIKTLKQINNLAGDKIYAGQKIIIQYMDTEFK